MTFDSDKDNNSNFGDGFLALLGLPIGSTIAIDGHLPVVLKRDDFVGFTRAPMGNRDEFHMVAVRAGIRTSQGQGPASSSGGAFTVGFVLPQLRKGATDTPATTCSLIRKYDPTTEEVSAAPVDEATCQNLLEDIHRGRVHPERVVDYHRLFAASTSDHGSQRHYRWSDLTGFISPVLLERRGIRAGDKIVAGTYEEGESEKNDNGAISARQEETATAVEDGKSLQFPGVPLMNPPLVDSMSGRRQERHSHHLGTKRFLAALQPPERTRLFVDPYPGTLALEEVLARYYDRDYRMLLGDVQLSYVVFLQLHCYASFSHWRDLVAMMATTECKGILQNINLFSEFLDLLACQLSTMESDFFDDAELSGENFFVPSMQQLTLTASKVAGLSTNSSTLNVSLSTLNRILSEKFPDRFGPGMMLEENGVGGDEVVNADLMQVQIQPDDGGDDEVDDDGPIVVSSEEVELSLARSEAAAAASRRFRRVTVPEESYPLALRKEYPILFAAMMPSEDVLMTCARALDDATDVSLVREAGAYLEHVEARKAT